MPGIRQGFAKHSIDVEAISTAVEGPLETPSDGLSHLKDAWTDAEAFTAEVEGLCREIGYAVVNAPGLTDLPTATRDAVIISCTELFGTVTAAARTDRLVWDVRPAGDRKTISGSSGRAEFHTDSPCRAVPESIFGLWCVRPADNGGESILVDGLDVLRLLEATWSGTAQGDPCDTVAPFWDGERLYPYPVFGRAGRGPAIRYRTSFIRNGLEHSPPHRRSGAGKLMELIEEVLLNTELHRSYRLEAEQVLFVNNHRMLHSRGFFTDDRRHLLRARADGHRVSELGTQE